MSQDLSAPADSAVRNRQNDADTGVTRTAATAADLASKRQSVMQDGDTSTMYVQVLPRIPPTRKQSDA
jgi:hypothetical protein